MTGCTVAGTDMIARLPAWAEPLIEASRKAGEDTVIALRLAEEFGPALTASCPGCRCGTRR